MYSITAQLSGSMHARCIDNATGGPPKKASEIYLSMALRYTGYHSLKLPHGLSKAHEAGALDQQHNSAAGSCIHSLLGPALAPCWHLHQQGSSCVKGGIHGLVGTCIRVVWRMQQHSAKQH
jgi:hypothetical protein